MTDKNEHRCQEPKSSDFQDGQDAEGCWMEGNQHHRQVVGSSGVYLIVKDEDGNIIRDDRPWQMTV